MFGYYLFVACWQQISFRFPLLSKCIILHIKLMYIFIYQGRGIGIFLKQQRLQYHVHFRTEGENFILGKIDQNCFIWIMPDILI